MNTNIRIVDPKEYPLRNPPAWMERRLIRWRFWLFGAFCLAIIAIEYLVEPQLFSAVEAPEVIEHTVFLAAIVSVGVLAEILLRTAVAKSDAVDLLEIKYELSGKLEMAADWNKLVDLILAFGEAVADPDSVALFLGTESGDFLLAAQSQTREYLELHEGADLSEDEYPGCAEAAPKTVHEFRLATDGTEVVRHGYCLPLITGARVIAKLTIYLRDSRSLTERQTNIFKNCASDLAVALTTAQMRKVQADLLIDQARSIQRHAISRNLHDALGQKLIYLRFKLDQLVSGDETKQLGDISDELEQMLAVANESCELVRGTLAVLNSSGSPYLLDLLIENSKLIANRTRWKLTFDEKGPVRMLLPETLQQVLYIFGEALSNAERHAEARKVTVELLWNEADLVMKITDDGCGFEPAEAQKDGHYGLTFMRERVQSLGGCMDLQSTIGTGTRLTIDLPIRDNRQQ